MTRPNFLIVHLMFSKRICYLSNMSVPSNLHEHTVKFRKFEVNSKSSGLMALFRIINSSIYRGGGGGGGLDNET